VLPVGLRSEKLVFSTSFPDSSNAETSGRLSVLPSFQLTICRHAIFTNTCLILPGYTASICETPGTMSAYQNFAERHPLGLLTSVLVLWKSSLLLVALSSPGIGYDTSTSLLQHGTSDSLLQSLPVTLQDASLKLVRWDAIYFTQIGERGHLYEQDWAFGIGLSTILSTISSCKCHSGALPKPVNI